MVPLLPSVHAGVDPAVAGSITTPEPAAGDIHVSLESSFERTARSSWNKKGPAVSLYSRGPLVLRGVNVPLIQQCPQSVIICREAKPPDPCTHPYGRHSSFKVLQSLVHALPPAAPLLLQKLEGYGSSHSIPPACRRDDIICNMLYVYTRTTNSDPYTHQASSGADQHSPVARLRLKFTMTVKGLTRRR